MKLICLKNLLLTVCICLSQVMALANSPSPTGIFRPMAGEIPLSEDNYEGIYRAVDNLKSLGLLGNFNDRPYDAARLRSGLGQIDTIGLTSAGRQAYSYLRARLGNEAQPNGFGTGIDIGAIAETAKGSDFNWRLYPQIEYQRSNFYLISRYTIESGLVDEPRYQGNKWRGFGGYGSNVYGTYQTHNFQAFLGRRRIEWGPGRSGSLILSGISMPYDGLSVDARLGRNFNFSAFTFFLDPFQDTSGIFQERYLSGHRLLWMPGPSFNLGFSEIVIYGGEGRNPEIYYIIPLFFLHGSQLNQRRDDNAFIEADFRWSPVRATEIYGQLLLDDFQIENKTLQDHEPAEYGFLAGLYRSDIPGLRFFEIRTEYARVTNRTYNQPLPRNRYLNQGYYIGHPLGNDGDTWLTEVTFRPAGNFWAAIKYSYARKGEGKVEIQWTEPWLLTETYGEKFPTGIVQNTRELSINVEYWLYGNLRSSIRGWIGSISNVDNVSGLKDNYSGIRFSIDILL